VFILAEKLLQFTIPNDLYEELKESSSLITDFHGRLRTSLAVGMFAAGEISLSRAAQVASIHIADFINLLKNLKIPIAVYTDEMLDEDLNFAKSYRGSLK
jgi:predicted HTH domain antitoxin